MRFDAITLGDVFASPPLGLWAPKPTPSADLLVLSLLSDDGKFHADAVPKNDKIWLTVTRHFSEARTACET